ncbi:MAG: hypothetical protein HYZ42_18365, partial [Bacteroidetes bacterium]|nr:hypothetical protein [Bacteroidota bacterium]
MKNCLPRCSALLLVLIFIFSSQSFAQDDLQQTRKMLREDKKVSGFSINEELKTVSVVSFKENTMVNAADTRTVIRNYFDLDNPVTELKLQSSNTLRSGIIIQRYKLFVNNIPVVHSSYNVMLQGNKIMSIHAESYAIPVGFLTAPSLTADNARTKALDFVSAKKYAWQALA